MARALIVGCGCRGRALGKALSAWGWQVRGTSRSEDGMRSIRETGLDAALADPERPGTLLELIADVALVFWLLGCAAGEPQQVTAIHGARLSALLERLVDTPVRGFLYEGAGDVDPADLRRGAEAVAAAGETWRIPGRVIDVPPADRKAWLAAMLGAARELTG